MTPRCHMSTIDSIVGLLKTRLKFFRIIFHNHIFQGTKSNVAKKTLSIFQDNISPKNSSNFTPLVHRSHLNKGCTNLFET